MDDNRRMNAERFQQQFYSGPVNEGPAAQPELDAGEKQTLIPDDWLEKQLVLSNHEGDKPDCLTGVITWKLEHISKINRG